MEKVREVALQHFSTFDISVELTDATSVDVENHAITVTESCRIIHLAFYGSLFPHDDSKKCIALRKVINNSAKLEKGKANLASDAKAKLSAAKEPVEIFGFLAESYRIPFFKETKQFLSQSDYNRVLRRIVPHSIMASSPS